MYVCNLIKTTKYKTGDIRKVKQTPSTVHHTTLRQDKIKPKKTKKIRHIKVIGCNQMFFG